MNIITVAVEQIVSGETSTIAWMLLVELEDPPVSAAPDYHAARWAAEAEKS